MTVAEYEVPCPDPVPARVRSSAGARRHLADPRLYRRRWSGARSRQPNLSRLPGLPLDLYRRRPVPIRWTTVRELHHRRRPAPHSCERYHRDSRRRLLGGHGRWLDAVSARSSHPKICDLQAGRPAESCIRQRCSGGTRWRRSAWNRGRPLPPAPERGRRKLRAHRFWASGRGRRSECTHDLH